MKAFKFISFLAAVMYQYRDYCIKTGNYCDGNFERIHYFDTYCSENHIDELSLQTATDKWFQKRESEINNSCRSRTYPVIGFLRYACHRDLLRVDIPEIPDGLSCSYVPHIFTDSELSGFFKACDNVPLHFQNRSNIARKMILPVIFRVLFSTGMRTFEVRQLKRNNIDLSSGIQDYIDVSIEQSRKSLNTLKDEQDRNLRKKWKKAERGNSIRIIAGTMK